MTTDRERDGWDVLDAEEQKRFRVNYGQGQVSNTFSDEREAALHLEVMDVYRDHAFIEIHDPYWGWRKHRKS